MNARQKTNLSSKSGLKYKKIKTVMKSNKRHNKLVRGTFFGKKWYPYGEN